MEKTPEKLIAERKALSKEKVEKINELMRIKQRRVKAMIFLLAEHKTMNKAELYFGATDDGQREIFLEMYLKGLTENIRVNKGEIDLLNAQSWGRH